VLSFPPFRLDVADQRLWKDGRELRLRPKPFAILCYLTQHPRRLVTRSEVVDAVWGRIAMCESLVRTHVRDLRHVLGEDVIESVVGRGYRFLTDVSEIDDGRNRTGPAARSHLELVRTPENPTRGAVQRKPTDLAERVSRPMNDERKKDSRQKLQGRRSVSAAIIADGKKASFGHAFRWSGGVVHRPS
jgi:DNA-binding winged helix-turn-helix (wHTH) protein